MRFKDFIKDKIITILLLLFGLITIEIFLCIYPFGGFLKVYIPVVVLGIYFIGIDIEYLAKRKFYNNLLKMINELDEKYLITEIVKSPNFIEGKILKESLQQIDKSMLENVNKYKYLLNDYKDYIELWIHEIKLPIASRQNGNRKQ